MTREDKRINTKKIAERRVRRDHADKILEFVATNKIKPVLLNMNTTLRGLSEEEVLESRSSYGKNKVTHEKKKTLFQRLVGAFVNPFTAILFFLAVVSAITDIIMPIMQRTPEDVDPLTVIIICTMVFISGTLVGDIVHLSAGDMVPADLRILEAKDLFISQASLTGESDPVEKTADVCSGKSVSVTDFTNIAFMGSNVISGSAVGVVVAVGDDTLFGSMASSVAQEAVETNFTKGVNAVSWVLIRFMLIMVPIVFMINGLTKGDWLEAFLFGISVAVGLTPEMLPMIVTTCLAKGAVSMSKKKTIVKNLNSIQNFGAIDILCTDKTGTLTQDKVVLEYHMDVTGNEDVRVLRHAYLNSYFQTGYKNLMDLAIIQKTEEEESENPQLLDLSEAYEKIDEVPFDFSRRRLSTVVRDTQGKTQMITKGAVEEMLSICSSVEYEGKVEPMP